MKDFGKFTGNLVQYLEHNQQVCLGKTTSKWFAEFFDQLGQPKRDGLLDKYYEVSDCGSRSALKEMLDFQSVIKRAYNSRLKRRKDFFVDNAVRLEGARKRIGNKDTRLSDMIIS